MSTVKVNPNRQSEPLFPRSHFGVYALPIHFELRGATLGVQATPPPKESSTTSVPNHFGVAALPLHFEQRGAAFPGLTKSPSRSMIVPSTSAVRR